MNPLIATITAPEAPAPDLVGHVPGLGSRLIVLDILNPKGEPMFRPDRTVAAVVDQWGTLSTIPMTALTVVGPAPADWTPESLA